MLESPSSIFVYGTLKTGQCRSQSWPRLPAEILPARTSGLLYDLGPYPALRHGENISEAKVAGELWRIRSVDLEITLATLDRIECFGIDEIDLYTREIVPCEVYSTDDQTWRSEMAFAYFLANGELTRELDPIPCSDNHPATWSETKR